MGLPKGSPKPAGSGRKKGSKNKIQSDVKLLAQDHGPAAIGVLARIMKSGEHDTDRIAAAKEMLNRGYGRAVAQMNLAAFDGSSLGADYLNSMAPSDLDTLILKLAAIADKSPKPTGG